MEENERIVRDACRVIWTEGDVSRTEEFYASDFVADYPFAAGWGIGSDGVRALAAAIRASFPDQREEIEDLVVQGDTVAVQLRIKGTNTGSIPGRPATGARTDYRDMTFIKLRDGKIVRQTGLTDFMTKWAQEGVLELPDHLAGLVRDAEE